MKPREPHNPLSELDHKELVWLFGILRDACRERLEKNLISQAFEDRLYQRGVVEGRLDPRPFLKIWEPRYRKFLDVANEIHTRLQAEDARDFAAALRLQAPETVPKPAPKPAPKSKPKPARPRAKKKA